MDRRYLHGTLLGRDTTGAIVGQIACAFYGADAIPQSWISKLSYREDIESMANDLYSRSTVLGVNYA